MGTGSETGEGVGRRWARQLPPPERGQMWLGMGQMQGQLQVRHCGGAVHSGGGGGSAVLLTFRAQRVREERFRGQHCAVWQNVSYWGHKKNVYTLRVGSSVHGPVPLHYEVRGYNSLLGSHYDKYEIEYSAFGHRFAPSIFQLPHGEQSLPTQSPPGDAPA